MTGHKAWLAVLIGALVCGGAAVLVVAGVFGGLGSARPLPRGELVVATLPAKPAALDRAGVVKELAAERSSVKAPALTDSACLDAVAKRYATAVAGIPQGGPVPQPTVGPTACGGAVQVGWVRGVDPSGVIQSRSVFTRDAAGVSPLADAAAKRVGVALVAAPGSHGSVSGYVLAWAVSR
ncbi:MULTISPECIES: hypothetical protein [unclassified Leifsonia]|uniref:hypothetical protein n=1 Tax=unclassified Leifsonia TaxID=2663824 RepID=UPI0011145B2F|nr:MULTISPECIES: hypothetical protein [unclassified Leifsonia]